jgi:glycosyltransferase involved in cell wall biosynthesis
LRVGIIGSRGFPLVYSGYESLVAELAPALARLGHDVTVYCHRGAFRERPHMVAGVRLVYVGGLRGKNVAQLSHSALASAHAMASRPDVVLFVNVANGPLAGLLAVVGIPTVVNVDGVEWRRPKWSGLGQKYFRWAASVAARQATELVSDAAEMRALYLELFARDSAMIAYGAPEGVTPDWGALARRNLRRGSYFLVMGRLIPDNNGDLIASEFVRSGSSRRLVILGDVPYVGDPYAEAIRRTFASSDVLFTGYVSDPNEVQALLEGCAGYLHGHEFGGTNPSLVWAMSAGCRILALDTRFAREVLQDDRCGAFFTKEPGSLASLIRRLEADEAGWEHRVAGARKRAATTYSWARIIREYESVLMAAASRGRG